jgi:hypothetical protein
MKKILILILPMVTCLGISNAQDTINHITSKCLGYGILADPCPDGLHFKFSNDTLEIYGKITANCCGEHYAIIKKLNDKVFIRTVDTGNLCLCVCKYCFNIKIPASVTDTVVEFNGQEYRTLSSIESQSSKNKGIEIFPIPAGNKLEIEIDPGISIRNFHITDLSGKIIHSMEYTNNSIDLQGIDPGTYLIVFNLNCNRTITKRIIVK